MAEMEGNGTPPTDADLQEAVVSLLQGTWDLNSITLNTIKTSMEEKFQCSLLERKAVMKQALTSFLEDEEAARAMEADQPVAAAGAEDGDDDEEQDDEHEPRRGEDKKRKRSGGGFTALVQLSTELAEFLGEVSIPRTEVSKRLWAYIKEKGLQNSEDKREILNDEAMQKIFKAKKMTMFSMNKLLSSGNHLKSLKDLQDGKGEDGKKDEDEEDEKEEEGGDEDDGEAARPKKAASKPKAKPKAKPKKPKDVDEDGGEGEDSEDERT